MNPAYFARLMPPDQIRVRVESSRTVANFTAVSRTYLFFCAGPTAVPTGVARTTTDGALLAAATASHPRSISVRAVSPNPTATDPAVVIDTSPAPIPVIIEPGADRQAAPNVIAAAAIFSPVDGPLFT